LQTAYVYLLCDKPVYKTSTLKASVYKIIKSSIN